MRKSLRKFFAMIVLMLTLPAHSVIAGQIYHVVDLGPGVATAIASNNDAAGSSGSDAVYWTNTAATPTAHDIGVGQANGINDSDAVVGKSNGQGFLYNHGTRTTLGTSANAINDAMQIVGNETVQFGYTHAFYYANGTIHDLGTIGNESGSSFATGINANGVVIGQSNTPSGNGHAFMTGLNGSGMYDLRTLDGSGSSTALGINDNGLVVGQAHQYDGLMHAFQSYGNGMNDLGAGKAYGVNDNGDILGVNVIITLDNASKNWSNISLAAINNNGWIAGSATAMDGTSHAVELYDPPIVPEPSSILLVGIGLALLALTRKGLPNVANR